MKIALSQIAPSPKEISYSERIGDLNLIYPEDKVKDFRFPPFLEVKLVYYRSGQDIFFQGWLGGTMEGCCARCLKSYFFPVEKKFDFALTPGPLSGKSRELNRDEMGVSFYTSEEIDLSPFVKEQVLLTLPMRPLCEDGCRGFCGGCGVDLNDEACLCASSPGDLRMALFRNLKLSQQ